MRSQLRRFAAVGVIVTAVDFAVLAGLRLGFGWPVVIADAIAIAAAAVVSFLANRALTFTRDPHLRWVDEPLAYGVVTALAGVIDITVVRAGLAVFDASSGRVLLISKVVALGVAGLFRLVGYRSLLFRRIRAVQHEPDPSHGRSPGDVRLSVVIPAWRAEKEIGQTIASVRSALEPTTGPRDLEIVVVDDGSPDATADAARAGGADQVIRLEVNRGKGAAVRAGVLAARGRVIAFTDADLAYDPALLLGFLAEAERGWDVVVGSRRHIETVTLLRARRLRIVTGRLFNILSLAVLLGAYRDTQCGLKAFRSDAARRIFSVARIDRFAFDIEVFHLAERYRMALLEVPVTLANSERSSVRVGPDSLRMLFDLLRIRRLAGRGAYD